MALIQELIPLGLMAVGQELQRELEGLAGRRYTHGGEVRRYGWNPGTVKLGGQRVPVKVPRLRGPEGEVRLRRYELLHRGSGAGEGLLQRVLYGISCRNYETTIDGQAGNIGTSRSPVSREFKAASHQQLKEMTERKLEGLDIVAIFIDGKFFVDCQMVVTLGVGLDGKKSLLGFVESDTEDGRVLGQFLRSLSEAAKALQKIRTELETRNQSAMASLDAVVQDDEWRELGLSKQAKTA